jgi:DNA mismatch repair protein MutL
MPESRVRLLPEEVANQIAAGEVVERPASVVKELVENSVDAGATRLTVEMEEGGRRLIQVADNGCGMSPQDAVLALQRHATSKITSADDLGTIRSLGFRGEALPSIASVSRLTLVSRAAGEMAGVRVVVEGGEIVSVDEVGAPQGTTITVCDLFYNVPARLKFLKTPRTELSQACDALTRVALAHSEIAVRLLHEGQDVIASPGSPQLLNAIAALWGRDVAKEMLPVGADVGRIGVSGYVSQPSYVRSTRSQQAFFVNGRYVRSRTLTHALDESFRATMGPGRFPVAVLHISLDPALVDVNVHPTKAEVRFLREWEVHHAVHEAVKTALGAPAASAGPAAALTAPIGSAFVPGPGLPVEAPTPGIHTTSGQEDDPFAPLSPPFPLPDDPTTRRPNSPLQPELAEMEATRPLMRPVAQLLNRYIVAEGPTGLLLLDQHLAHERVLFDRLARRGEESAVPSQRLATPLSVTLTRAQALLVEENTETLREMGFELEAFGGETWLLRAAPAFLLPGTEADLLRDTLDELAGGGGARRLALRREQIAAMMACKGAIKKGTALATDEVRRLVADLAASANPFTCPHGYPIAVEISYQELSRRFRRH